MVSSDATTFEQIVNNKSHQYKPCKHHKKPICHLIFDMKLGASVATNKHRQTTLTPVHAHRGLMLYNVHVYTPPSPQLNNIPQ